MPKVLIAGEKAFAVHSFTDEELNKIEMSETRNESIVKIGKVFDEALTEESINSIKPSVIMLLKQSDSYKLSVEDAEKLNGYALTVFKGKTLNGKKNYIANWLGKMPEEAISENPQALIPQLVKGFKSYFRVSDYHKKSAIHSLLQ